MFFLSVDKDNDTWTYNYSKSEITSKKYYYEKVKDKDNHYTSFRLNLNDNQLHIISNYEDNKVVSKYKKLFISDYKIWFYVIKIKRYIKLKEKLEKDKEEIEIFEKSLKRLQFNYKSEIRKEKLIKLDN